MKLILKSILHNDVTAELVSELPCLDANEDLSRINIAIETMQLIQRRDENIYDAMTEKKEAKPT